jgi:hypothetical protein
MADILTPHAKVPLYSEIGLTEKESNTVYFEVMEMMAAKKTNAEALKAIAENPRWNTTMKTWAAYNLYKEMIRVKLPWNLKPFMDKLGF